MHRQHLRARGQLDELPPLAPSCGKDAELACPVRGEAISVDRPLGAGELFAEYLDPLTGLPAQNMAPLLSVWAFLFCGFDS